MLGAFLSVEMVPWISFLFAVSDILFIFFFLPETLPQEKRVGPGPGVRAPSVGMRGFPLFVPVPRETGLPSSCWHHSTSWVPWIFAPKASKVRLPAV